MAVYGVWQRTIVDDAGNIQKNALVEVRKESDNTLADRKSTRLNSSHIQKSRMPSSA